MKTTVKKCCSIVVFCAMLLSLIACNPDDGFSDVLIHTQGTDGEDGGHKEDPDGN